MSYPKESNKRRNKLVLYFLFFEIIVLFSSNSASRKRKRQETQKREINKKTITAIILIITRIFFLEYKAQFPLIRIVTEKAVWTKNMFHPIPWCDCMCVWSEVDDLMTAYSWFDKWRIIFILSLIRIEYLYSRMLSQYTLLYNIV